MIVDILCNMGSEPISMKSLYSFTLKSFGPSSTSECIFY